LLYQLSYGGESCCKSTTAYPFLQAIGLFLPAQCIELFLRISNFLLNISPELVGVFRAGKKLDIITVRSNIIFKGVDFTTRIAATAFILPTVGGEITAFAVATVATSARAA
jgi:hypothetical protein